MAAQVAGQVARQTAGQANKQVAEQITESGAGSLPQAAGPHGADSAARTETKQTLQNLLQHPQLWQAGKLPPVEPTHSSGFASLDENLPGHGWPQAGLAEFMLNTQGIGELQLLIPLLQRLSQEDRWIAWVNPPLLPYAPALAEHGIDLSKILLIHPKNHKDALWAMECASKSGTCSVVLGWLDEKKLKLKDTRRLQLAAKTGNTFSCLFRPESAAQQPSMAELRISLKAPQQKRSKEPVEQQLAHDAQGNPTNRVSVTIEKRRRGWPVTDLPLRFTHAPYAATEQQDLIHEQLNLWRALNQSQNPAPGSTSNSATASVTNSDLELTQSFNSEFPSELATILH